MATSVPASADPWGTGTSDTGAHPDGSTHNYCFGNGLDYALLDNINTSMNDALGGPTHAVIEYKSTCVMTGSSETDVVWLDTDLPGLLRGLAACNDFSNGECDQTHVYLDPVKLNEGNGDNADTTKTTCHELGHTVGLTHGPGGGNNRGNDCMISGERPTANIGYERYSAHHRGTSMLGSERLRGRAARAAASCLSMAVLTLASACGSADEPDVDGGAAPPPSSAALVEILRAGAGLADYEPSKSPEALAQVASLSVVGTVQDIADGRVFGTGRSPSDEPSLMTVILTVRVDKVLAGNPSLVRNGRIYVELFRTIANSVGALREATPPNQRVILFLDDYTAGPGNLLEPARTVPVGAPILAAYRQGFLLEDSESGRVVGGVEPLEMRTAPWREGASSVEAFVARHFPTASPGISGSPAVAVGGLSGL